MREVGGEVGGRHCACVPALTVRLAAAFSIVLPPRTMRVLHYHMGIPLSIAHGDLALALCAVDVVWLVRSDVVHTKRVGQSLSSTIQMPKANVGVVRASTCDCSKLGVGRCNRNAHERAGEVLVGQTAASSSTKQQAQQGAVWCSGSYEYS